MNDLDSFIPTIAAAIKADRAYRSGNWGAIAIIFNLADAQYES